MPKFYSPTQPLLYSSPDDSGSTGAAPAAGTTPAIDDDRLNRIVADHVKRALKKTATEQAAQFEEIKKLLTGDGLKATIHQALTTIATEEATTAAGAQSAAAPGKATESNAELEALKARLAEYDKRFSTLDGTLKAERKAKEAAEARARATRTRAALEAGLTATVDKSFLPVLLKALGDRVDVDEHDQPRMKFQRNADDGTVEDEWIPLDDGLKRWASEEGKSFIPARAPRLPSTGLGWPQQYAGTEDRAGAGGPGMPWLSEVASSVERRSPMAAAQLAAAAAPPPKPPK